MREIKQLYKVDILGPLRFLFAVSVIAGHLWSEPAGDGARHAVIGFFCISGYLITRIRLTSYCGAPALSCLTASSVSIRNTRWLSCWGP
jgi:peptidoglycan/LPS O-acetylase OafA/YrhL